MINPIIKTLHQLSTPNKKIFLTGNQELKLTDIITIALTDATVNFNLSKAQEEKLNTVYEHMLEQVRNGVPIYGATTAYGAQASKVLTKGEQYSRIANATKLSEAIIHVDVSTGDPIPPEVVRAAMMIRINMLLPGHSAVRLQTLNKLKNVINAGIIPIVGRYGTVGASGDLAQNGRVLATLLQLPNTYVWDKKGKKMLASQALSKAQIKPLKLMPKEGLGMVNGDNFSTAATSLITYETASLMLINTVVAALNIQALRGSNRDFHPLLSNLRPHPGQKLTASLIRNLLKGSKLAYQEMKGHVRRDDGVNVQDPYSIRCLPQYFGPDWERLMQAWNTIEINANSVSDNPLWTTPEHVTNGEDPYQWVSGGNFLAMHMSDTLDALRKIVVHIVKQNDRHLSRMINPYLSNGLPANLSDKQAISSCTFKGLQTQMGMYEVYATIMAAPVSTAFGVHEELNQDLTSHAMTSAIMTWEVLKIARRAIATNLIAACQAIDLRGGKELLSPATLPYYDWMRQFVPYVTLEQPLGHYVELIASKLNDPALLKMVGDLKYE